MSNPIDDLKLIQIVESTWDIAVNTTLQSLGKLRPNITVNEAVKMSNKTFVKNAIKSGLITTKKLGSSSSTKVIDRMEFYKLIFRNKIIKDDSQGIKHSGTQKRT